ncbi:YgfZ/GcvT domain-containing protein [Undibacterium rugosum]|uniref:Folate-binding protein YgfZ n=1 Tax=Undibacterium rugosum TaxID=2762291 RepID=A0A923I128_9BURK|nr:folate-binding protein YgfZ [Undibacterium rugosum]MBC3935849.1 folate-binding protein YgfZ [Undibacterium rugosum]MBR7779369.1 folate-binding protein YgfZ [Undibacterium rugosum]
MLQEFAARHHVNFSENRLRGYAPAWNQPAFQLGFVSLLADQGLTMISGEDAASFLHGQISNDVERLPQNVVRRAAYCTAKGRMLASFLYWKTEQGIMLQMARDLQASTQKRLQMFVLRAKANLTDCNEQYVSIALGGTHAAGAVQKWFPDLPAEGEQRSNDAGTLIRQDGVHGLLRLIWICPVALADQAWTHLSAQLAVCNSSDWYLSHILAGIPYIQAATQEKFVPQMINFELVGGVNFKKGCYPGQEIVARSQYLGKLKRRMALGQAAAAGLVAGMDVYHEAHPEQACGTIVNAENADESSSLILFESTLADQEAGVLRVGSPDGPVISLMPLPYPIVDVTRD